MTSDTWPVVGARVAAPEAEAGAAAHAEASLQDVPLAADRRGWAPRQLPRPLTASAGSRAAATVDATEARESLRQAAVEERIRRRAAEQVPPSIERARTAREPARTAFADDAEIEAHVRDLLARRAVGQ